MIELHITDKSIEAVASMVLMGWIMYLLFRSPR